MSQTPSANRHSTGSYIAGYLGQLEDRGLPEGSCTSSQQGYADPYGDGYYTNYSQPPPVDSSYTSTEPEVYFLLRLALSLLLVVMVSRDVGLRVGLEGVQTSMCSRWGSPMEESNQGLFQDGDVVIDCVSFMSHATRISLEIESLKYVYAMEFAVEEINSSPSILPGVRTQLPYPRQLWETPLGHAGSPLAGGGGQPELQLRRQASPRRCHGKNNGERRTIPSDVYQAKTMARLAITYHWTWVGAVVANNDYGRLAIQVFQEEIEGSGVCLAFLEAVSRETIKEDARRAAETIQQSTARVILIFCWYTDVRELFLQLAKRNVTDRQFLASEAWSTSGDLLHNVAITNVASGVLGVAIRSASIPGFEHFLRRLHPSDRPADLFLREFWEKEFGCSLSAAPSRVTHVLSSKLSTSFSSATPLSGSDRPTPSNVSSASPDNRSPQAPALPLCSGRETLEGLESRFTATAHLRVTYNVYLAVYAAAHALHSLLSCPDKDRSPRDNSSTCSSPYNITPKELLEHLNKVNFITPQGEKFFFQGADIPAVYDLVNWQTTDPDGPLKLVIVGRVDGSHLHLNQAAVQWRTGSSQVPVSVCSESCPPGTRVASRKGEPVCCFDCVQCAEGEVSNETGSPQCQQCALDFWSNDDHTECIPRIVDFLSFNETMGITLTTAAVSGAVVTAAVFVIFLCYRQTPLFHALHIAFTELEFVGYNVRLLFAYSEKVRANNSELSFLLLLSLKLCFLCTLVFIGQPSVWSCRLQQAAFGISFVLCISCLLVKTIVVLAAFRSAQPGAGALMKWFGPGQQRGSVCLISSIQVFICIIWLSLSPPFPHRDLGFQGSKVNLDLSMSWVSLLLTGWASRAPSLLLVVMVSRDVGLRVGLEGVQTSMCSHWGSRVEEFNQGQDGDVVLGGLFNLHYQPPVIDQEFIKPPFYIPCTGLEVETLKTAYAMEFAVEEINNNPLILPGVKLNYRILDSCARQPWVLQGAFSLISYLASCPCLSNRHQFPNFFRTIPSDVYQAKTMARLAILFNWTWIGAVIVNNDYGRLAIQTFQEEIAGSGVCLAFSEHVHRETIKKDARRAATTIQQSTARVILIFCWYTDVRELFLALVKRNVTGRQFLASEAWSTSKDLLQDVAISEVASEHLNKVNFTTPHGEEFFFEGADIPAAYDLVNWQTASDGESCPLGTRIANRKGEPVCCFDCIPCTDGEVSNETGSHQCRRCPIEFWSNPVHTACIPRKVDFLAFNETMGIVLTTGAVSGVVVRANNSELSFLLLLSLKLCFLCSLVFIGRPSVWSCRLQQAAFGISFVLCVKTIVVLAAFRSARPGAGALMKWFGPGQQRGSVCFFTSIQVPHRISTGDVSVALRLRPLPCVNFHRTRYGSVAAGFAGSRENYKTTGESGLV
ncbi:Extracellular calcium-sensing receptor [Merluccius polli]|uniref:Extracellular calcium-sensing receptor n=1 Tax=Merluccius polli TaxID=89951 RepID=A0AA47MJG3_MERPO|nr:Extracellular calcium-sensing receptor [Merluccius polli]